jgi:hypothetical protein
VCGGIQGWSEIRNWKQKKQAGSGTTPHREVSHIKIYKRRGFRLQVTPFSTGWPGLFIYIIYCKLDTGYTVYNIQDIKIQDFIICIYMCCYAVMCAQVCSAGGACCNL